MRYLHRYDVHEYVLQLQVSGMKKSTRRLTVSAMMTALGVVFLYLACIFPTGQLGFAAVASLFGVAAVVECGIPAGLMVYVGTSLLGLLLLPDKAMVYLFMIFFGLYPVVKSLIERLKKLAPEWALKLLVFNAALCAARFLLKGLALPEKVLSFHPVSVFVLGNLVFILYDIGLTRLIAVYIARISKRIRR